MSEPSEAQAALRGGRKKFTLVQTRLGVGGIGGAGCNAVERLLDKTPMQGHELMLPVMFDTDVSNLVMRETRAERAGMAESNNPANLSDWILGDHENACQLVQLGPATTKGGGAGGNPAIGGAAAREQVTLDETEGILRRSDITFLIAGLGGGTGTEGIQVIAQQSVDLGKTTVCFVTMPFGREGQRAAFAHRAEKALMKIAPTVVIQNERLYKVLENRGKGVSHERSFELINEQSLDPQIEIFKHLILSVGMINLDAMDFKELCSMGSRLYIGFNEFPESNGSQELSGEEIAEQVFTGLTTNPFQRSAAIPHARGYMLALIGPNWTIEHEENIKARLDGMLGERAASIRTWTGIFPDEEKSMAILITATPHTIRLSESDQIDTDLSTIVIREPQAAVAPGKPLITVVPERERTACINYVDGTTIRMIKVTPARWSEYEQLKKMTRAFGNPDEQDRQRESAEEVMQRIMDETGLTDLKIPPHLRPVNSDELKHEVSRNGSSAAAYGGQGVS